VYRFLPALVFLLALPHPAVADNSNCFPADTELIISVNFKQMLASKLAKDNKEGLDLLKGMIKQDENVQKLLQELGFDPFRDLDGITVVGPPSADPVEFLAVSNGLAVINGRFDQRKILATAEKVARENGEVVKITRAGKHQLIEIAVPGKGATFYVVLADATTLLVSQRKAIITAALARVGTDKEPQLKKEVRDLLASQAKEISAGFVATGPAVRKLMAAIPDPQAAKMAKGLDKLLDQIDGFNGSITLADDLHFQLGIGTKDAETAKLFAQGAPFGLLIVQGLLAKQAKDDPKLAALLPVLKTLTASSQGNTFILRGRVPAATLEKALKGALDR
jgi:hypothetical protein